MKNGKKGQSYPGIRCERSDIFKAIKLVKPNQWRKQHNHENISVEEHFHFGIIPGYFFANGIIKTTTQHTGKNEEVADDVLHAEIDTKNIF